MVELRHPIIWFLKLRKMENLLSISLRQSAIFIAATHIKSDDKTLRESTSVLIANLGKLGFSVSEDLLHALNGTTPAFQAKLLGIFAKKMGINKNWTPLVKGWDVPTGESVVDHIITFLNAVFEGKGTRLACGHVIPKDTFPLERYNGCPFCGTPFEFGKVENFGLSSKKKLLTLWTEADATAFLSDLLTSKTALDTTQMDSLKILLPELPLPDVTIGMKETLMAVIDTFVSTEKADKAEVFFTSPTDILRYLWYKHTGFLQIIEPKTIVKRGLDNTVQVQLMPTRVGQMAFAEKRDLKLNYSRMMGIMVAKWLNNLPMDAKTACEIMHPKRGMWVRFIRALRLAEFSKRAGFEQLKALLDCFYNEDYSVFQGRVNHFRLRLDAVQTLNLLKQRPGLFARSLFANMLWFGADETLEAFKEVVDKVPARLIFTLNMYADIYFDKSARRSVKPLGGVAKNIATNPLLSIYDDKTLDEMKAKVEDLCLFAMKKRFAAIENAHKTMFIEPTLFKMPVSIGDRSESVQDLPSALMGARFAVEGDAVRLFMQWGNGLPAQHLDMDLSCTIAYENTSEFCSYSNLNPTGCKHSGDIQHIPNYAGTAEYIDLNINELEDAGAQYVTFTCNAFTMGNLSPNMVVGWMNSDFSMQISAKTGVAYDPSCVQHQIRIAQNLSKGLTFGVLEMATREIIWLEMPFSGQIVQGLDVRGVKALLSKLTAKLSIGNLLAIKAEAQGLKLVETAEADEVYDVNWAMNAALVTQLLVD
jgi:hypothetical protein